MHRTTFTIQRTAALDHTPVRSLSFNPPQMKYGQLTATHLTQLNQTTCINPTRSFIRVFRFNALFFVKCGYAKQSLCADLSAHKSCDDWVTHGDQLFNHTRTEKQQCSSYSMFLHVFLCSSQVDGTEDARITIRGVGGTDNVILRGSGESSRLFQIMHDYYTLQVRIDFLCLDFGQQFFLGSCYPKKAPCLVGLINITAGWLLLTANVNTFRRGFVCDQHNFEIVDCSIEHTAFASWYHTVGCINPTRLKMDDQWEC